jgi:hypothetical protein
MPADNKEARALPRLRQFASFPFVAKQRKTAKLFPKGARSCPDRRRHSGSKKTDEWDSFVTAIQNLGAEAEGFLSEKRARSSYPEEYVVEVRTG